jgi:hypothetical protein
MKILFGNGFRADQPGRLEYEKSPSLRRPLADPLKLVAAFSKPRMPHRTSPGQPTGSASATASHVRVKDFGRQGKSNR